MPKRIRSNSLNLSRSKALPALGVTGKSLITNFQVIIGSARLMSAEGLEMPGKIREQAEAWKEAGYVVVYAGWDGQVKGILGLGETVRAEAKEVVIQLQSRGLDLSVLTGDEAKAGERWERSLGIPVQAALSPDEKMRRLSENAAPR